LATWEDHDDLKRRFPKAPAWGQAGHQGRENVNTGPEDMEPHQVAQRERRARKESSRFPAKDWAR
jgi:leucyl aminopeptidase